MAVEVQFLTPFEAAKYAGVHRETLYDLIRRGTVNASKFGGRWRIPKASLDDYLREDQFDELASAVHEVLNRNP